MNDMKKMIKDAAVLLVITVMAGLILGFVYQITKEPIAAAKEKAMRRKLMDAPEDYVIKMAQQGSRIAQEVAEERGLYY